MGERTEQRATSSSPRNAQRPEDSSLDGCDRAKLGAAIRASGLIVHDDEIVAVAGCRVDFIDGGTVYVRPSVIRASRIRKGAA